MLERRVQAPLLLSTSVVAEEETNVLFRAEIFSSCEQSSVLVTM